MSIIEKSQLIDEDEYRKFIAILANKSKILFFTVARLYEANNNEWRHVYTGLLALTKDNSKKKYMLEMYSMDDLEKSWEHIITVNFIYNDSKEQIHTFKINDDPFLLSFANLEESKKFSGELKKLQIQRKEQKDTKKRQSQPNYNTTNNDSVIENKQAVKQPVIAQGPKAKGTKISKSDISNPTNFKHVDHMGLHDHFFENPEDEHLKTFLKKNNMESWLDNDESKREIYEFIDQRGGLKQLESEMKQQQQQQQQQMRRPPPVPQKNPPPPPDRSQNVAAINQTTKPHPPVIMAPPPPPIGIKAPPPPQLSAGVAPPPPPPPPPAPVPQPMNFVAKPTSHGSAPPPPAGKGGLLAEIEKFDAKKLKARSQAEADEVAVPAPAVGGSLLDSLAQFLVQRKTLWTGTSDSEGSDDNDDEDENWKD